jgi:hypothetical protein
LNLEGLESEVTIPEAGFQKTQDSGLRTQDFFLTINPLSKCLFALRE